MESITVSTTSQNIKISENLFETIIPKRKNYPYNISIENDFGLIDDQNFENDHEYVNEDYNFNELKL